MPSPRVISLLFLVTISGVLMADVSHAANVAPTHVVGLRDAESAIAVAARLERQGTRVGEVLTDGAPTFGATLSGAQAAVLQGDQRVRAVSLNDVVRTTDEPVPGVIDPLPVAPPPPPTWGLDRIDQRKLPLDGADAFMNNGARVPIFVVDTGVRASHNDLWPRVLAVSVLLVLRRRTATDMERRLRASPPANASV